MAISTNQKPVIYHNLYENTKMLSFFDLFVYTFLYQGLSSQ